MLIFCFQQNSSFSLLSVQACIRKGRPPRFHNGTLRCEPDLLLTLSSANLSTLDASKLLPYPEPDVWFIGFQTVCSQQGYVPTDQNNQAVKSVEGTTSLSPLGACTSFRHLEALSQLRMLAT